MQGARELLKQVKVIHLEVAFRYVYMGQPLFSDIHKLLRSDFRVVHLFGGSSPIRHHALRWAAYYNYLDLLNVGSWFIDAVHLSKRIRLS